MSEMHERESRPIRCACGRFMREVSVGEHMDQFDYVCNAPAHRKRWRDKHGDVWTLATDGLMYAYETAPFPRSYVERKWGPLVEVSRGTES